MSQQCCPSFQCPPLLREILIPVVYSCHGRSSACIRDLIEHARDDEPWNAEPLSGKMSCGHAPEVVEPDIRQLLRCHQKPKAFVSDPFVTGLFASRGEGNKKPVR